ncbi:MAG: nitrite reductase [Candidatus Polarisedimenticolaceae bacterium]|nr:nitrite reductase [Candidatus Polarisedimenticolaceae bacterium]
MAIFRQLFTQGLLALLAVNSPAIAETIDADALYQKHCAECHSKDRLGAMGPALLPENLKRLRKKAAIKVISEGRAATQMPTFQEKLNAAEIEALVDLVYTPLKQIPHWGLAEMRASHLIHNRPQDLADKPIFTADMWNLFIVVELGDHHATLLDGDTFEPIHRFPTRFALHGGPKYGPNGRFVYFASRDGWISKFDIYNLKYVAEIRAGINTRNLAVSADGRYVIVANYLPHSLTILDAVDLSPIKVIPVVDLHGNSSRVSAVYTAAPRESFFVALKDIPEMWEISYADQPPLGFSSWVHGYREDSGDINLEQQFAIRRVQVKDYLDDFFITQDYVQIIGTARDGSGQVLDLDLGRAVTKVDLPGMPHLSSAISWTYQGRQVMAMPNIKEGEVTVLDMESWQVIKRIKTLGPGFFMRSHEKSRYAWVDVFFGPNKDVMHVIDKETLEVVKTLRPSPGKTSAHVEFTQDGRYALVSIWEKEGGAIVVYDANTLKEVKRLPMSKPSGKYNVHNKVTRSRGTSH